jgi:hypothetical protein
MTRAAMAAAALALGCGALVGPDAASDNTAIFESVWQEVDRHYALFAIKPISWDSLHDVYAPQAAQASGAPALAQTIGALLAELRDVHVDLFTPGAQYRYTGYDARPVFFDPALVLAQYVTDRRLAPRLRLHYGHLAPDVGYVWIPSFSGSAGPADYGGDIDAALAALPGVSALVVDVRSNGGGSSNNDQEVASRFADQTRTYGFVQWRNGPRHDDLTPPIALTLSPRGPHFPGPVVVLVNRRSFSATEDFVVAMSELPTVTIVGDSTGGAVGNPIIRELPNGWTYRFPQWRMVTATRLDFEERGFAPEVFVRGSSAELAAGRDAMLDSALAVVRRAAGAR